MSALDTINANGQDYDIMSPEVVSDYVEKIGTICKNPNGYTKGSLFLARDAQNVERMYKATSAIASNQTITSGTNCTVKKLGDLFNDVDSDVSQLKQALADEAATRSIMGAKNVYKNTLENLKVRNTTGSWSNNVYTQSGLTYTVNDDMSITVNGTNNTSSTLSFCLLYHQPQYMNMELNKPYLFTSDGVSDNAFGTDSYYMYIENIGGSATWKKSNCTKENRTFTPTSSSPNLNMYISVAGNTTVNNITFYPMVRLASDANPTYQPWAMTNRELTDAVQGNYVYKGKKALTVTGDGVKTFAEVIYELRQLFITLRDSSSTDYLELDCLDLNGTILKSTTTQKLYTSGVGASEFVFNSFNISSGETITNYFVSMYSSASTSRYMRSDDGVISNRSNNAATSGGQYILYLNVYEKIG